MVTHSVLLMLLKSCNMNTSLIDCRVCDNCKRRGFDVPVHLHLARDVERKWKKIYYNVESGLGTVALCSCCDRYLMSGEKRNDPVDYWPAMLYTFLSHENQSNVASVPFAVRWKIVPEGWRRWWKDAFWERIVHDERAPLFRDVTEELLKQEEVLDNLKWMELAEWMDKHFAFPEVSFDPFLKFKKTREHASFLPVICICLSFCPFANLRSTFSRENKQPKTSGTLSFWMF